MPRFASRHPDGPDTRVRNGIHAVGIVGSGPMATYLVKYLIESDQPLAITLFEARQRAGVGMPYDPEMNAEFMLCNAFSREIPAPVTPLIDWLKQLPERVLSEWELSTHDLSPRAFYPRVLIGEYLAAQFQDLCAKAQAAGHTITVRLNSPVSDILPDRSGKTRVQWGAGETATFDAVLIASGHAWPTQPEIDGIALMSPWPHTRIARAKGDRIGILGSSLSAVDVAVALGHARGRFEEHRDHVIWLPDAGQENLSITMVSHMGVMPEGDFYYPFPYEPLQMLTRQAVADEIAKGEGGLLDRVFALLLAELDAADPEFLGQMPPDARTVEGFRPAYFKRRHDLGGFRSVVRDRAAARASLRARETVPHRYALLRAHEVFDGVLRDLSPSAYARFRTHLLPVFADCYAAIPHLSLARIIALYEAGVLNLGATGTESKFAQDPSGTISVETEDGPIAFDTMIDARGQPGAPLADLPFPSLVENLSEAERPIAFPFRVALNDAPSSQIYCLAMPQLLERHPFTQGLADCAAHARRVVAYALQPSRDD